MADERKTGCWVFDHCHACAENDEGRGPNAPGDGCMADGPCDGCEAVWIWKPARSERTINLADLGFRYRVSDEALAEIEAAEVRAAKVLTTADRYLFRSVES